MMLTADEDPRSKTEFRTELSRLPHLHRLHVGPLSREGVRALVRLRLGAPDERLADGFFAASGGNPGLLRALIDDHRAAGRVRRQGYGAAVLGQLRRWGEAAEQLAAALALLGSDASPGVLAEFTGQPQDAVEELLESLSGGGLLDGGAFRHPIAPQAVLDGMTVSQRAERHRAAAGALRRAGASAEAVARHLVAAGGGGAEPWTLDVLREAADRAQSRGDDAVATNCLTLAVEACTTESERTAVRFQLLQSQWCADSPALTGHLAPAVEGARAGHLEPAAGTALVRQLLWLGRPEDATQVLARLDAGAGARPGMAPATTVEHLNQWLSWSYPGLGDRRRSSRVAAAPTPLPESDAWLTRSAFLADSSTRARTADAVERATQVLAELPLSPRCPWAEEAGTLALHVLLAEGRTDEVRRWCEELRETLSPGSPVRSRALALAFHAEAALRLGDLAQAVELAREALDVLSPASWGVAVGQPLSVLLLAAVRLGWFDVAATCLRAVPEAIFDSRWGLAYLYARGHYYLATGHHRAALADFLACGDLLRTWGADVPSAVPWRTGAAEACLRLGNQGQVKRLLYEQLGRPESGDGRNRALALYVLAIAGPAGRRAQLLSEALALFETAGDRYEQARVLTALSLAHHELGARRRARMLFRRARHMAVLCDAEPLRRALLAVPEELRGGADAEPDSARAAAALTESEFRVAVLAVRGYTNREIAHRLFVTASTVEQHLTRVYRKFGVKGRKELPTDLEWSSSAAGRSPQLAAS
jgi:DNA-binding CsgD family transcriptional regulator